MSRYKYFACLTILTFLAPQVVGRDRPRSSYRAEPPTAMHTEAALSEYGLLTPRQLLDTAVYYNKIGRFDSAEICYNLIINSPESGTSAAGWQKLRIDALNGSAVVHYYWMSDYVGAYRLLLDALDLCERYPYKETEYKIQANTGNIFYRLGEYGMAGHYYSKALELCTDSISIALLHNNIGAAKMEIGELDSAFSHIEKALRISSRHTGMHRYTIFNTTASIYKKRGLTDSAFHYLRLSLNHARKDRKIEYETENLSDLGKLFFETGLLEEAESYIIHSNVIAKENNLNNILLDNHLLLSKIESSRGNHRKALEYLEKHNRLKDSLFGADKLGDINQLQRISEVSKTNRQIERLAIEHKVKERIISHQKVVLFVVCAVLLFIVAILLFVFRQKRKLNRAYRALFEKNVEIMELQERPAYKCNSQKRHKDAAHYDGGNELLDRILVVMEDVETICNSKFSINVLASLVEANHIYVSQVINNTLHKNFRSFLNGYRIREAQRLFSKSDAAKFTIESVSLRVGYKSMNTFRAAFQEITGVSPGFYLKSMRETTED